MAKDDKILWAFLSVLLLIAGFFLVLFVKKNNSYVTYYAKHGLVLFLGFIVVWIVGNLPFVGWIIRSFGIMLFLILWITALFAALSGEKKTLPIVTELAEKINI